MFRSFDRSSHKRRLVAAAALAGIAVLTSPAAATAAPTPSFPVGALIYTVNVNKPSGLDADIFYTTGASAAAVMPNLSGALSLLPDSQPANVIRDKAGNIVWRYQPPPGQDVSNFRTQTYHGRRVLTWWQGADAGGHGYGEDYIADDHYRIIDVLTPGGGLASDVHEFRLTPDGHALITAYRPVTADLSAIGGPKNGTMFDCIASVIDVATKKVLFRWDAMRHVPVTDTEQAGLLPGSKTYDPFHMNSIALDPSGNLVISMRNTSSVYDVDSHTGAINWILGGKRSTMAQGPGVEFAFQHDAEFTGPATVRMFNDNSSGFQNRGLSSVEWINVDPAGHRATLVRNQTHPSGLVAFAMGNAQALPNGDTFVGWGMAPHISELSPTGQLVYDASLPSGTYRAYLDQWPG
jgi:hypothetical protein